MRSPFVRGLTSIMLLGFLLPPAAAQDTLEEVEQAINEKWERLSAYSATMHLHADIRRSGIRLRSEMRGPMVVERLDDGRVRYRGELDGTARVGPLSLISMDTRMLMISDGDTVYSESRLRDQINVTKSDSVSKSDSPGGGGQQIESAAKDYELRVLPPAVFEGHDVYVIEGIPKPEAREKLPQLSRILLYFDQATGIQLNMALLDASDKPLTQMRFSNIRLNPRVDPAQFEYTIPPGAVVKDNTQQDS